ncbi:hypothetical protein FQR65_LT02095 [Abscondita terminalis]|nr:hypothetical protein FQR65_LT02095 [Abscondita terminalis]
MTNTFQMCTSFSLICLVFGYLELPKDKGADLKNCVAQTIQNIFGQEKTLMFVTDTGGNFAFPDVVRNPYAIINSKFLIHYRSPMQIDQNYVHVPKKITVLFIAPFMSSNNERVIFKKLWRAGYENVALIIYERSYKPTIFYSDPYATVNRCKQEVEDLVIGDCISTTKYQFKKNRFSKYPNCNIFINLPNNLLLTKHLVYRFHRLVMLLKSALKYLNTSHFSTEISHDSSFQLHQGNIHLFKSRKWDIVPYFQNDAIYVVPSPSKISPMIVLKNVFKSIVWILVFLVFVCTSLTWWLLDKYYLKNEISFVIFNIYSITLLGSIYKVPLQPPLRLIFIAYVIYSIHIQTAFTSNLIQLLTVPQYEPHIQTLEDLADSKLPILTTDTTFHSIRKTECSTKLCSRIYDQFQVVPDIGNVSFYISDHNCFFIDMDRFNTIGFFLRDRLHNFKDNRFSSYFLYVFGTYETSNFFNTFKNLIQSLSEMGDDERNYKFFQEESRIYQRYRSKRLNQTTTSAVVITLEHVCSPFAVWGLMLFSALMIFILEVIIYNCR